MDLCPTPPIPQDIAEVLALLDSPERVREIEEVVLRMPQVDLQTQHIVHGGIYMRTVFIPAGTFLTGALTNCDNLCIMVGDIAVTTDHGPQRLTGHHVLPARAGYKRVGVALADTWWAMAIATPLTDVHEIEDSLTDEAERLQTRRPGIVYAQSPALEAAT